MAKKTARGPIFDPLAI